MAGSLACPLYNCVLGASICAETLPVPGPRFMLAAAGAWSTQKEPPHPPPTLIEAAVGRAHVPGGTNSGSPPRCNGGDPGAARVGVIDGSQQAIEASGGSIETLAVEVKALQDGIRPSD